MGELPTVGAVWGGILEQVRPEVRLGKGEDLNKRRPEERAHQAGEDADKDRSLQAVPGPL